MVVLKDFAIFSSRMIHQAYPYVPYPFNSPRAKFYFLKSALPKSLPFRLFSGKSYLGGGSKRKDGPLHIVFLFVFFSSLTFLSRKSSFVETHSGFYRFKTLFWFEPSQWDPPSLSQIYAIKRPLSPDAPLPFTTPQILAAYSYRHNTSTSVHDLFVFASGLNAGGFSRNFDVAACLVDKTVYPASVTPFDVVRCTMPHAPGPYAIVSLILRHDEVLKNALTLQPITVRNMSVTLPQGVITDPPKGLSGTANGSPDSIDASKFKMVASTATFSAYPTEETPKSKMVSAPRYHICLTTMIKPFANLLEDWISYHRRVGVDKVFILDNLSKRSIEQDFENRDDVEVMYWPFQRSQVQGMTFMLLAARARCEWIISADVDEYLMTGIIGNGPVRPLQIYLQQQRWRKIHMTKFSYIDMVGNRSTPAAEPIPIAYTHQPNQKKAWQGKSACRTDYDWKLHMIHVCEPWHLAGNFKSEMKSEPIAPNHVRDSPKTIHYRLRSWEEFKEKARLGSVSTVDWANAPSNTQYGPSVPWFRQLTKNTKKWTRFRDVYRFVMGNHDENEQTLVWLQDGKRCEVKKDVNTGSRGPAYCHKES